MRKSILFLLLFVSLVTVLMVLFFKYDKSEDNNSSNTEKVSQESVDYSVSANNSPDNTYITQVFSPIEGSSLSKLEKEAVDAVSLCAEIYSSAEKGSAYNTSLSDNTVAAMVAALGEGGYSAIDYAGDLDMVNYEPVADFGECINIRKNAECAYFVVHPDGLVHEVRLTYSSGQASALTISMEWDKEGKPSVYTSNQYPIQYINYTSNGWLIFGRVAAESLSEVAPAANSNTLVRVVPYDNIRRQLCSRYISSVSYAGNNLFTIDWNSSAFAQLDFNSLYPALFGSYNGTDMLTAATATSIAGLQMLDGTNLHLVPSESFERIMGHYFNIGPDMLRILSDYSPKNDAYYILAPQSEFESSSTHLPEPEVIDYWYNSDGSLTMKVNAVSVWYGTDCSFTHDLTIMETKDGFKYISNHVYPTDANNLPSTRLITERKTEISQIGKGK